MKAELITRGLGLWSLSPSLSTAPQVVIERNQGTVSTLPKGQELSMKRPGPLGGVLLDRMCLGTQVGRLAG